MLSGTIPRIQWPASPRIRLTLPAVRWRTIAVALTFVGLAAIASAPAVYWGWNSIGAFNSPDENAAYMTAQLLANDGRLYFQDGVTELGLDAPIGPRGFVHHDGRGVTYYPLGHPAFLGVFHRIFGSSAPIFLALIPTMLIVNLALIFRILNPRNPLYLGFFFLAVFPIWYWSSRVYVNIGLTALFLSAGVLCFVIAMRRKSIIWFAAASGFLALTALVRESEAPFLLLLGLSFTIAFIRSMESFDWASLLSAFGAYAIPQLLLFLLPMFALNWWTFGSPFTSGYILLYEQSLPERLPDAANILMSSFNFLKLAFFPVPIDIGVVFSGVRNQMFFLVPFVLTLGIAGVIASYRDVLRVFGIAGSALLLVAVVYVLVSRADPGTYLALSDDPDVRASVVRYWMPLYLLLGIGSVYVLSKSPRYLAVPILVAAVALSAHQFWSVSPESLPRLRENIESTSAEYRRVLENYTEPEALIIAAGSRDDKWIAPVRRMVYDSALSDRVPRYTRMAELMHQQGTPVYFVARGAQNLGGVDVDAVTNALSADELGVQKVDIANSRIELWKLGQVRHILATQKEGSIIHTADAVALGGQFSIEIVQDGSSLNYVANPSFEAGLYGWRGPNNDVWVTSETDDSMFGSAAMRMELDDSGLSGEFVRSTYSLDVGDMRGAGVWSARVWAFAPQLQNATALMRIYIKDRNGDTIDRREVSISEASNEFQPLVLEANSMLQDADNISIQLGLRADRVGGSGVVFWDGAELVAEKRLPTEYCDGDNNACVWLGDPHSSYSQRDLDIASLTLSSDGGERISLKGPFRSSDRLDLRDGGVYLNRVGAAESKLTDFPTPEEGKAVTLEVESDSAPIISIVPEG